MSGPRPDDAGPGIRRTPQQCLIDAIERSCGWQSEALRELVEERTGVRMSPSAADAFSQEVAELIVHCLIHGDGS